MPYCLTLPSALAAWKVKIFDNEVRETPHVTIVKRSQRWRINLRTGEFMDSRPSPKDVDEQLLAIIDDNMEALQEAWNRLFPNNPV